MVRAADIEAIVSAWSGVPVERLTEDEMTKLVRLVSRGAVRRGAMSLSGCDAQNISS